MTDAPLQNRPYSDRSDQSDQSDLSDVAATYRALLARRRAAHRAARAAAAVLLWLTWAALLLVGLLAADYALAFEPAKLAGLGRGVLIWLGVTLAWLLVRAGGITSRRLAADIDAHLGDRRQPCLSALDLAASYPAGDVATFLTIRAVEAASECLRALPATATLPLALLRRRALMCGITLAATAAAVLLPREITDVILARYLHPYDDIPPYSRLIFTVRPAAPVVVYGDDAELAIEISGPETPTGVQLLTRVNGSVQRTPCFNEGSRRFAQRIERVTAPVEFCFAAGRARSRWSRVMVNLEPRIAVARVTMAPPAYSLQPVRTFVAGDAPLQGLANTRVRLEVTCNRPLKGGMLTLTPAGGTPARTIAGHKSGRHVVRFEWDLRDNAALEVTVADLQGTPNRTPYRLKQRLVPDARPEAVLTEPPPYALATPDALLRLAGYADDDLGLRRVDLVRGLNGYHDRVCNLGPASVVSRLEVVRTLDLSRLGVTPGQTLEFFLEATDTNPDESGRTASEVVRVEIVSEEDYAQMLRERLDTEQFMARYEAAATTLQAVRDALKATADALQANAPESDLAARRRDLAAALDRAETLYRALAADVPIYAMEKQAREVFKKTAAALGAAQAGIAQADDKRAELATAVAEATRQLAEQQKAVKAQAGEARFVAAIARVKELEQAYCMLVAEQAELARRYQRYSDPARIVDTAFFRAVEDRQALIRKALAELQSELRDRAKELPDDPELTELRKTALRFVAAIDGLRIADAMTGAEQYAAARDGVLSKERIELALDLMRQLLKTECGSGGFGNACCKPKFCPTEDQNQTLKQLGQCKRPGFGRRMGLGMGGAGTGEDADGYSAGMATPLNIPMIGPQRTVVLSGREGTGPGKFAGSGTGPTVARERATEHAAEAAGPAATQGAVRLDDVPDKYREALKAYFGTMENRP